MSNDTVSFQATSRTVGKKSNLSEVRDNGGIPAVVYKKGEAGTPIQLNEHDFQMMLKKHSGENLMIDLEVDGAKAQHVLIKEIQHHPLTQRILHVDFHEIRLDRRIKVEVPVEVVGTPIGVSRDGGTLDVQHRVIEVECKASDLVENLPVDVAELAIGDHISAGDITLPADFTLLTAADISIVTVLKPRVKAGGDAESEEEAGAEGGEPEVITGKSDEEEAGSEG
jgi:large subunit ribosomal protein L25